MAHSFITCSFCGKCEDLEAFRTLSSPIVAKMRDERLCFDCAYWKMWLEHPEPETVVIDGGLYKLAEPLFCANLNQIHAAKTVFVVDPATDTAYACRDLPLRAIIPPQFISKFPDRYHFITKDEYCRMYKYDAEMCLSKGCFDRYHCLWYRADIAEPDEPWNEIPQNYVIGGECCPSFVEKTWKL